MDSETAVKVVRDNVRWFIILLFAFLALVALAAYLLGMRAGAKEAKTEILQMLQPQMVCDGRDNDCGAPGDELDRQLIIVPDDSGSIAPLIEELFRGPPPPIRQRAPQPPGVWEI